MRTIVKGKNLDVPPRIREYAERKLARLARLTDDRTDAVVELWTESHRAADDSHFAEVHLVIDGRPLRSHASGLTFQAAIDAVVDRLERQTVEFKERPRHRARTPLPQALLERIAGGTTEESGREPRIVKTKRFAIEPMFEEDAIAAMEELGHSFFLFVNAETERINVLYRRRNGDLGLIEPIVAGQYTPRTDDESPRRGTGRTGRSA